MNLEQNNVNVPDQYIPLLSAYILGYDDDDDDDAFVTNIGGQTASWYEDAEYAGRLAAWLSDRGTKVTLVTLPEGEGLTRAEADAYVSSFATAEQATREVAAMAAAKPAPSKGGMMMHHSSERYEVSASRAAANARTKFEALIAAGQPRAMAVIERVMNDQPLDQVATARALRFEGRGKALMLNLDRAYQAVGEANRFDTLAIHPHAMGQLAEVAGIPAAYVTRLKQSDEWGMELLAHNLAQQYEHKDSRHLLRSVKGELRGFVSDKFRRLDSRPIVEAFAQACSLVGAVPVEGHALDTKIALKAMLPHVFEPVENEVMGFGLVLQNSDFGDGALSVRVFVLRPVCTNYAIADEALRQVHLGKRLDDSMVFSDRTYRLDTEASVSALTDVVRGSLSPERLGLYLDAVRAANAEGITAHGIKAFLEAHVTKAEAKQITEAFSSANVVDMPAGQTKWRLSNAISWIAGHTEDEHRRLDLEHLAGKFIHPVTAVA